MARRRDLFLSEPEIKAETLRRVHSRGRATILEVATILGWSDKRVRGEIQQGHIQVINWGHRQVISLEELDRLRQENDTNQH